MNAQEQALLDDLLRNLHTAAQQVSPESLDADAAEQIRRAFAAEPKLAYLITQRQLLLQQALQAAQAKIRQLESAAAPAASGSFLGMPAASPNPQVNPQANAQTNAWGQPLGRAPMAAEPAPMAASMAAPGQSARSGLGGGSFLGTAAATATGVVGGALLFQGIEHLLGGGGFGGGMAQAPVEDITNVTENFYGSDAATDGGQGWQTADYNDPSVNPLDDGSSGLDSSGWSDASDDTGSGGLFDGLFGGGDGGDDWV
ncbi:DUF2076 family protein [Halothiobacillus sp. DCM-1]|uniref:DUF2076 family protein n=1 Tax=Halothiobacillus sp. DCM-1 TaxID=3112558 RepID=UPI003247EFA5